MKSTNPLFATLLLTASWLSIDQVSAGTVINTNLPSGTQIVNIDARADGDAAYSGDARQAFWYQPAPTAPSLTLQPGTYQFRIINPTDAASLYPALSSAQQSQIYTGWSFGSAWSENYMVHNSTALANPNETQLFDGALDPAPTLYGSPSAAYSGTIANGYFDMIRLAPPGRAGTSPSDYMTSYSFTVPTTVYFTIPDNGLSDNSGGVSVVVTVPEPSAALLTIFGAVFVALNIKFRPRTTSVA